MSDGISDTLDRVYENFFMRDLTYVFAGSLLLTSILYVYEINLINAMNYISQNFIRFIIFVSVSYIIGYIGFTGIMFLNIFEKLKDIYGGHKDIKIFADIEGRYGHNTIRRIERDQYLDRLAKTIGSATLISSLILLVPLIKYNFRISDIIIISTTIVVTIVCFFENKRWAESLRDNLKDLDVI